MVSKGSIGEEMDISPGDKLISINGYPINDILDYQFYSADDNLILEIEKDNGSLWSLEIEKDYDEELGLYFTQPGFDAIRSCKNRCIFCFVDQLPPDMRKTLYEKDDDYRHSFLYGNFITLTNLSENDWQKIIKMRLSPLYVSVHCIQGDLRKKMLKNPRAARIKSDLRRLQAAGIEVHTQIVLCPGWNDGEILTETIRELASLYPSVASIGIVPVGLTRYRDKLPQLSPVTPEKAKETIENAEAFHKRFRSRWGRGLVYLADEFYLRAGYDIPDTLYYDDFCQIENGIGLVRKLLDDFDKIESDLPVSVAGRKAYIITGKSAQGTLQKIAARLNQIEGLSINIISVNNNFFGTGVSVCGLLTGNDIIDTLGKAYRGKRVIISRVMFREGQDVMLDDISLEDIKQRTQADIRVTDGSARSLLEAILAD